MVSTYVTYQSIARDMVRTIDRIEKQPIVARDTAYYLENITKVKSIEEFLDDDKLYRYAMKAHGLGDMTYAKAFMRKVLEGGIDASDAFANQLADKRYRDFASTFNFVRHGETTTVFTRAQQGTVDLYARQTLEEEAGNQNEGVRLALYFERKAAGIEDAYDILADQALAKVVRTALGLPDTIALSDVDKQAALLGDRIDFEEFSDPEKLGKFLQRFTSLWELSSGGGNSAALATANLLFSQPTALGISTDALLTIQRLKL